MEIGTVLHEVGVVTDLEQKDVGVNTDDLILQREMRDLKRARKCFLTISGQMKIAATKISVLNEQIKQVSEERDRVAFRREEGVQIDEARIIELTDELSELRKELELQEIHMTRDLLPGIESQFDSIKETANTMLYFDRTLGKKIKTLFREQGITVVSIITAIGFAVYTIATSIT